MDWK
jgi:hypothetical protein